MTVVGQTLPQEAYNLRESENKGVAFRCVDRLRQGRNVQGMTQGKMTVVEREMERYGLAVMGGRRGKRINGLEKIGSVLEGADQQRPGSMI